tara:strand:+ start:299 stop:1045 length:747 start_codon:yes stop_codon:yes gene_type:complete
LPTISIVGYTNAGKSTLFNQLTLENSYVADKLFATLDSTLRRLEVEKFGRVILADTVGFIRQLPHTLVDAFRATLEEVAASNLLVHVVDNADDGKLDRIKSVNEVLKEIGAESIPQIVVFNKIDKCGAFEPKIVNDDGGLPEKVWLSARSNSGVELLHRAIAERLAGSLVDVAIRLTADLAKIRSKLYGKGFVKSERVDETGASCLQICLPRVEFEKLLKQGAKRVAIPELVSEDDEQLSVEPEIKTA